MDMIEKFIQHILNADTQNNYTQQNTITTVTVLAIAYLDYITGWEFALFILYIVPLLYSIVRCKRYVPYIISSVCPFIAQATDIYSGRPLKSIYLECWDLCGRVAVMLLITIFVSLTVRLLKRYMRVVQDQEELIFRCTPGWKITFVNDAYAHYYGKNSTEIIEQNILPQIFSDDIERINEILSSLSQSNQVVTTKFRSVMPNGNILWQEWRHRALFSTTNKLIEIQSVGEDITELKRLEFLKDDIERTMRHDLRSPLNGMIGLPQAMMDDENLTSAQREYLRLIAKSARRLLNTINSSLDLYMLESCNYTLKYDEFNLIEMISDISDEQRQDIEQKRISVSVFVNHRPTELDGAVVVTCDTNLTYRIIMNLLKNAIEASNNGDMIGIFIQTTPLSISIRNTNEVPREIRDCFFDKFVTSGKKFGTGLGTYSAAMIAKALGGNIHLDTTVSGKTTVTVNFPGTCCTVEH